MGPQVSMYLFKRLLLLRKRWVDAMIQRAYQPDVNKSGASVPTKFSFCSSHGLVLM